MKSDLSLINGNQDDDEIELADMGNCNANILKVSSNSSYQDDKTKGDLESEL